MASFVGSDHSESHDGARFRDRLCLDLSPHAIGGRGLPPQFLACRDLQHSRYPSGLIHRLLRGIEAWPSLATGKSSLATGKRDEPG